jgi:hypothetical protein
MTEQRKERLCDMCENMHLELCANKDACSCACHTWSTANPKKFEGQKILDQILDANVCEHGVHAPHKVGYGSTWCPGVAEKLGPMTPKGLQQVEDGVVACYFPHLADPAICPECAGKLVDSVAGFWKQCLKCNHKVHYAEPIVCGACGHETSDNDGCAVDECPCYCAHHGVIVASKFGKEPAFNPWVNHGQDGKEAALSRRHVWEQIMPEADAQQSGLERNAFLAGADAVLGLIEEMAK